MKRMKIYRVALSVIVAMLSITLSSCAKESLSGGSELREGYADLTLELMPPMEYSTPESRMSEELQNKINRAVVLLIKNDKVVSQYKAEMVDVNKIKIEKVTTSKNETDKYDIVIIGNGKSSIATYDYVGKTKEQLRTGTNLYSVYDGKWTDKDIPMWGEVKGLLIHPVSNTFQIKMLRALARIEVGLGKYDQINATWPGLLNFKLNEVTVMANTTLYDYIPNPDYVDIDGNVTAPSAGLKAVGMSTKGVFSGSDITNQAYIKSTIFIAEDDNYESFPIKIILRGRYDGAATDTYYCVRMRTPKPGTQTYRDMPILRNHLYRIDVTSISGPGYSTSDEAAENSALNNIVVDFNTINEGGSGEIVFDAHASIATDVSQVLIYGKQSSKSQYTIANINVNYDSDAMVAKITGQGLISPISTRLQRGTNYPVVIDISNIAAGTTVDYTIEVGRLKKVIQVVVHPAIDAHFDFLPFRDVASITTETAQSWLTLSHNRTFVKSEQQFGYIIGDANNKAVIHFDENIAITGAPRQASALLQRTGRGTKTRLFFVQINLSGMVMGDFGGKMGSDGYTKRLAVESVDEFTARPYDDPLPGVTPLGLQWGFSKILLNIEDIEVGHSITISLAEEAFSINGVVANVSDLSIYNNYAARYCYDKNRDTDGNGTLDDKEIMWYMPAQNQLLSVWVAGLTGSFGNNNYWCLSQVNSIQCVTLEPTNGALEIYAKNDSSIGVRCVRDL